MLITALGLWVASVAVPGMEISGLGTVLGAAVLLGFVNALVRPLVVLLTLPITILTLGIFLLVINAAMLGLVASLFDGFVLHGFWSAVFGAVIVGLVSWFGLPR
jgi:putative membrane protein